MVNKSEIEVAIKGKDDFVKLDYLSRYLRQADSLDVKRFILSALSSIQEGKGMFMEAAKNIGNVGEIAVTYKEKRDNFMKEAELWIQEGNFDMADKAVLKALQYGNENERIEMRVRYLDLYKAYGSFYEDQSKLRKALEVYERLFSMKQTAKRKMEIKDKLLEIYNKLGRTREFYRLRDMEIKPDVEI